MATKAFLLIVVAAGLHACWNLAAKKTSGDLTVIWIGLVMASFTFAPFILFLTPGQMEFQKIFGYIIASGLVHSAYFYLLGSAYEHGDISVVYPIARGSGIGGTAIVALLFLDESLSLPGSIGIALIGMGICSIGFKGGGQVRAVVLALLVGLTITVYSILAKLAVEISHPLFYLWGFLVVTTLLLAPYVCLCRRNKLSEAWKYKKKYSVLIGPGSMATYLIVLCALQMAQVSYVVAARELAVVFGSLLGFVLLKEPLTARKIIGIVAVVLGIVLIKVA